jgi:hypothetical protein
LSTKEEPANDYENPIGNALPPTVRTSEKVNLEDLAARITDAMLAEYQSAIDLAARTGALLNEAKQAVYEQQHAGGWGGYLIHLNIKWTTASLHMRIARNYDAIKAAGITSVRVARLSHQNEGGSPWLEEHTANR